MATIATQISELAGTTAAVTSLNDFAAAAINKLTMLLPREVLDPFTSTESETYSATAIATKDKRIFDVYRAPSAGSALNRKCELMDPGEYTGELAHTTSMYYPTDYDPRWAAVGDAVRVLPSVASMVITVRRIALLTTFDTTGSAITTLPQECEQLVVLDCAAMVCANKMQALLLTALTDTVIAPTSPSLTTITYTNIGLPGMVLAASSAFDVAMTNEDAELATTQVGKLNQGLQEYQAKIQENLGALQKDIKNNEFVLQKYQSDVQAYAQKLQAEIGVYSANIQKMVPERDRLLALWSSLKNEYYELLLTQYGINLKQTTKGN